MLYLDSSALVKRYLQEPGSERLLARFKSPEAIFVSRLAFAEIHTVFGRKFRAGDLNADLLHQLRTVFEQDMRLRLTVVELNEDSLSALPDLVTRVPVKVADAAQLSTALWLHNQNQPAAPNQRRVENLEFGVADKSLAEIARQCGLAVFNPEDAA